MTGPGLNDRTAVSLAFANTTDQGYADAAAGAHALHDWLVARGLVEAGVEVTRAELSRFLMLRDAVRAVLRARIAGSAPDVSVVRIVEAAALAAPGTPIGVWAPDGSVTRSWRSTGGDRLDEAAATLAADVVDLVVDHGHRLRRAPGDGERFVLDDAAPGSVATT